jgi:hypothetical protein
MKTAEAPAQSNLRLVRIKTVSRIVRYSFLVFFAFAIGRSLWFLILSHSFSDILLSLPLGAILCFWYWKLAQLFHFYQQGLIFAPPTIRCIKVLGILCVLGCLLTSCESAFMHIFPPPPHALPPGVTVTVVKSNIRMEFFSFVYAGINLGMLLAGLVIILIAWIMDEGRKSQEEQELTV